MKVYNKEKTKILEEYDLSKGYLKKDILITHINAVKKEQEIGHYETLAEYKNGGRDVEWVVDKPGVEEILEHDKEEEVIVYIPYTNNELKIIDNEKKIGENKNYLHDTDYIIMKFVENMISGVPIISLTKEYKDQLEKRKLARKTINELEKSLLELKNNGGV